jgi:hypothetical protein
MIVIYGAVSERDSGATIFVPKLTKFVSGFHEFVGKESSPVTQ